MTCFYITTRILNSVGPTKLMQQPTVFLLTTYQPAPDEHPL